MSRGLSGEVTPPGDKSISHRALILAALARGASRLEGLNPGVDVRSTRKVLVALGLQVRDGDGETVADGLGGRFRPPSTSLDCGNSGTTMRLMAGVLAGQPFESTLAGDASLSARPMARVAAPLARMGADIATTDGHAPLVIRGRRLRGAAIETGVASAQVKSALLLAGLFAEGPTKVTEPAATRDHTERMLGRMGARITRAGLTTTIEPGPLEALETRIPGDPSAAAFYAGAAAIVRGSSVIIRNVGVNPTRAGFLAVLDRMGARISRQNARDRDGEPVADLAVAAGPLKGTTITPEEVPSLVDEIPILSIVAACAYTPTEISGASELRVKECDRLAAIAEGLGVLGVEVRESPDGLWIGGGGFTRGGTVDAKGDHRIAMSFAVAALGCSHPVTVAGSESVAISDPAFATALRKLASG